MHLSHIYFSILWSSRNGHRYDFFAYPISFTVRSGSITQTVADETQTYNAHWICTVGSCAWSPSCSGRYHFSTSHLHHFFFIFPDDELIHLYNPTTGDEEGVPVGSERLTEKDKDTSILKFAVSRNPQQLPLLAAASRKTIRFYKFNTQSNSYTTFFVCSFFPPYNESHSFITYRNLLHLRQSQQLWQY